MAVTLIASAQGKGATNLQITVPAGGVPTGALILVHIAALSATGPSPATDSASNSYSDMGAVVAASTSLVTVHRAYNAAALVNTNTINVNYTSVTYIIQAYYWDGAATASDPHDSPADGTATGNGSAQSATMGHAPAVASSLLWGAIAMNRSSTGQTQPDVTWTDINPLSTSGGNSGTNMVLNGGFKIASDLETYNPTTSGGGPWSESIRVFSPPSAASVPTGWDMTSPALIPPRQFSAIGGSPT